MFWRGSTWGIVVFFRTVCCSDQNLIQYHTKVVKAGLISNPTMYLDLLIEFICIVRERANTWTWWTENQSNFHYLFPEKKSKHTGKRLTIHSPCASSFCQLWNSMKFNTRLFSYVVKFIMVVLLLPLLYFHFQVYLWCQHWRVRNPEINMLSCFSGSFLFFVVNRCGIGQMSQ